MSVKEKINKYINYNYKFMQRALKYNSSSIYVDGTKSIRRAQIFARYSDVKVFKIIFLIRDGSAFCNSYRKNRKVSESDIIPATKEWNQYIYLVDELSKKNKNIKMITVRYEDLCNDKNQAFDKVKGFLNLDPLSEFETDKLPSHILGNRMRKNFNFDIQEDNSWESELSSRTVTKIEDIMLPNLLRYNYIN